MAAPKKLLVASPLDAPSLTEHEIYALRALNKGEATKDQQKMAFDVLIEKFARYGAISFDPASTRNSDLNEGRRLVGAFLIKTVTAPIESLVNKPKGNK